jgi:ABC-2 type transport system permease protein
MSAVVSGPAASGSDTRIYDQGYRPWTGPLGAPSVRFWTVAWNEIRQAWANKWFRRVVWVSFFPLGIFAVMALVHARLTAMTEFGPSQSWMTFWGLQLFFSMLVVYHLGRNAIAEDLRTGALAVYFSRPVSFGQYVLGKWLAVALGVAAVTLAPGLVLAVFHGLVAPEGGGWVFLRALGALLVLTALLCAVEGAVALALSSLAPRGRVAGILWVLAFFLTAALGAGLAEAAGVPALRALGFADANGQVAEWLFGLRDFDGSVGVFLLAHGAWFFLGVGVLFLRLRAWRGC